MKERNEQEQIRYEKLQTLREKGYPFPNDVKVTADSKTIADEEVLEPENAKRFTVAGRIVQQRLMGKAAFIHILDRYGKLQCYIRKDDVGEESYEEFKSYDIGDIVELSGYVFVTKTGEKTLYAEKIRLLTKSLIPLPEKWHGLSDVDQRYRYRYVDLIANPETREIFTRRAKIISTIRSFLDNRDFIEVEIPILSDVASGAIAKPFVCHYNAIDADMHLRVAYEIHLKKLLVGGLERVYELSKVFRNEGLSKKHNPEFTMIELNQAYATFEDFMDLTEELILTAVKEVNNGDTKVQFGGKEIDFAGPWPRISMKDSLHEIGGVSGDKDLDSLDVLLEIAKEHNIHVEDPSDWGIVLDVLWGELVEPKIINPVFITHHPFSISPFSRKNLDDPRITDRFELIIHGMELGNGFSELNDSEDQRERLLAQAEKKAEGQAEIAAMDEDFIRALEYGLPPNAGVGIGIDRLVMLLTDSHTIREVILFPQLKPLDPSESE